MDFERGHRYFPTVAITDVPRQMANVLNRNLNKLIHSDSGDGEPGDFAIMTIPKHPTIPPPSCPSWLQDEATTFSTTITSLLARGPVLLDTTTKYMRRLCGVTGWGSSRNAPIVKREALEIADFKPSLFLSRSACINKRISRLYEDAVLYGAHSMKRRGAVRLVRWEPSDIPSRLLD